VTQIPDFVEGIPCSVVCQLTRIFDSAATRNCLKGKRVVMLGDSTLTETMHDIEILLSGVAADSKQLNDYVFQLTHRKGSHKSPESLVRPFLDQPPESSHNITSYFMYQHRHYNSSVPGLNITLLHRFMGHWRLKDNWGGVHAFTHTFFQSGLRCLLGLDPHLGPDEPPRACPRPDIVLAATALHDLRPESEGMDLAAFTAAMGFLGDLLKEAKLGGSRVVWKGAYPVPHTTDVAIVDNEPHMQQYLDMLRHSLPHLDAAAKMQLESRGITFVELQHSLASVSRRTNDGHHYGAINRMKALPDPQGVLDYPRAKYKSMAMSTAATQLLLNAMCN